MSLECSNGNHRMNRHMRCEFQEMLDTVPTLVENYVSRSKSANIKMMMSLDSIPSSISNWATLLSRVYLMFKVHFLAIRTLLYVARVKYMQNNLPRWGNSVSMEDAKKNCINPEFLAYHGRGRTVGRTQRKHSWHAGAGSDAC